MRRGRGHVHAPQHARPSQDAALTNTAPATATAYAEATVCGHQGCRALCDRQVPMARLNTDAVSRAPIQRPRTRAARS